MCASGGGPLRGRHDPTFWVLHVCIAASVLISQALGRTGHVLWPGGRLWPVVAGLVLIVAGAALRAWSIVTLGRFFQYQIRIQAEHRVVTNGPYRYVRHPSYTGSSWLSPVMRWPPTTYSACWPRSS